MRKIENSTLGLHRQKEKIVLPRREAICLILLLLLTAGWFSGGREPIVVFANTLLSLILFIFWFLTRSKKTKLAPVPPVLTVGLIGFLGVISLSWLWSINRFSSFLMITSFLSAAAVFIVARDVLSNKVARDFWITLFLISAGLLSAIGFYFFFNGDYDRLISLFYWPNPLAIYLAVAAVLALYQFKVKKQKIFAAGAVLFLAGMILTYSRAAGICFLAVGTVMILSLGSKDKKIWLKNLVICLAAAILVASLASLARGKVFKKANINIKSRVSENQTTNTSTSDRLYYWRGARDIYADNMLLGVGAGGFGSIYPKYQRQVISAAQNPHNFYLQVLAELGIIGFAFMFIALIGVGQICLRNVKAKNEEKIIFAAALTMLLLHVGLDFDFSYPTLVFLAAILLAVLSIEKNQQAIRRRVFDILYGLLAVLLAVLTLGALSYYRAETIHELLDASLMPALNGKEQSSGYGQIESAWVKNPDYLTDAGIFYYTLAYNDKSGKTTYVKAQNLARAAIAADRYDARHYFLLATIYRQQGKNDLAIEYYKKSIELDPLNNPQYYYWLADLYTKQNKLEEAKSLIGSIVLLYNDEVIKNRSFIPNLKDRIALLYNQKANIEYSQGDKARAIKSLRKALELNPNYQDAKDLQQKIQSGQ